jgi:hypothetical protein
LFRRSQHRRDRLQPPPPLPSPSPPSTRQRGSRLWMSTNNLTATTSTLSLVRRRSISSTSSTTSSSRRILKDGGNGTLVRSTSDIYYLYTWVLKEATTFAERV